jgi:hypothetical protein
MFFLLFLDLVVTAFAQNKDELISKIINHPSYEAKYVNVDILKIKNKLSGDTIFKNVSKNNPLPSDFTADLTIDLRTIDTANYSHLYTILSEIPVFSADPSRIADANNDKRKEIYGTFKQFNTESSFVIYEMNTDGSYDSVYKYPDSLGWVYTITDLEKDGFLETANRSFSDSLGWYLNILTRDSITQYPTQPKLIYDLSPYSSSQTRVNFHDMDNDSYPEMIYFLQGSGDSLILGNSNHVARYDRVNNTLNLIYQNRPPTTPPVIGYAFGDFDNDGKQNFSVGSVWGEVFVYEYVDGNEFNLIEIDSLPVSNAFLAAFTNDLDDNGKPELWIGGDGYINGIGSTIIFLYEADGDDEYSVVYTIAVVGVISFFAGDFLPVDLDNDGKDEVLLCIDQNVLVFKNRGNEYKLYYVKRNELMNQNSVYYSATAADLDGDGYPEILISMDLVENNVLKGFSRIYKKSSTINVENEINTNPGAYFLSQAYPNPFNPATTVKYKISQEENVAIKVFDLLGKEIKQLLNATRNIGVYEITWDGTDRNGNKMPSGVYFINLRSDNFNKTIKTVLMK